MGSPIRTSLIFHITATLIWLLICVQVETGEIMNNSLLLLGLENQEWMCNNSTLLANILLVLYIHICVIYCQILIDFMDHSWEGSQDHLGARNSFWLASCNESAFPAVLLLWPKHYQLNKAQTSLIFIRLCQVLLKLYITENILPIMMKQSQNS